MEHILMGRSKWCPITTKQARPATPPAGCSGTHRAWTQHAGIFKHVRAFVSGISGFVNPIPHLMVKLGTASVATVLFRRVLCKNRTSLPVRTGADRYSA